MSHDPTSPMSNERLDALLSAYGADTCRWPEAERGAVIALIARSPAARAAVARAGELDRALDGLRPPAPAPELTAALMRAAPLRRYGAEAAPRQTGWRGLWMGAVLPRAAVFAALLIGGIGMGAALPPAIHAPAGIDMAIAVSTPAPETETVVGLDMFDDEFDPDGATEIPIETASFADNLPLL